MKKFFKLVIVPIAIVCLSACFLLPTQDADRDNSTPTETTGEKGSVKFAFSGSNSISANVMANSVSSGISYSTASTGETPSRVSISYRKIGATSDATTSLELSAFGGSFVIADPISLDPGNYEVTKFDVLNSSGRTIYSTPMTGSVIDNFLNISTSLAYGFTVKAGENEPINMTVVGVNADSKASDFGRDAFTYEVITYSEFYIAAYLQDEKYALTATPATLTIKNPSGTTITNKNLSAGENRILVADYDTYTFTVSKDSLATKSFTISKDSLAKHKSEALQVIFFSTPHAYKFINEKMTWSNAKAYCEGLGGYLVTITSQEENSYIAKNILVPNGAPGCWAGGSDRETEKTWKWVTGEAGTYNNWAVGEPNNWFNGTEDEDYLQIFGSNCEWNDGYETTLLPFICEWNSEADMLNACSITYDANGGSGSVSPVAATKLDEVTIASGSNLSKAGYTFIGWSTNSSATSITYTTGQKVKFTSSTTLYAVWKNNSLYKFINEKMTWSEAKAYCEGLGGHLVTITSQEENSYIAKNILVPNGAPGCWAGGTDRETEDTWKWVTGEAWTYNNWAVGEPNNWGDEDYLQIFGSNCNWNDGYETTLLPFICEWENEADIVDTTFRKAEWFLVEGEQGVQRRSDWWDSLEEQWKKAFNKVLKLGDITSKPSDENIQAIFKRTVIGVNNISLTNLSGVKHLTNLTTLYCNINQLSSLTGIENLTNLTYLCCDGNSISSLTGLENLTNLTSLSCWSNQLTSLTGLENCLNLTSLYCNENQLKNLTGLENCTNLKELCSAHNQLSNLKGIENLTNLTTLYCNHNQLSSLKGIENLTNLTTLYCNINQLSSLTGIENLTNLTYLCCDGNSISSLTGLEKCTNLTSLDFGYNQLSSLKGIENLTNLTTLYCNNNQLSSLTGLENCAKLYWLYCGYNQISNEEVVRIKGIIPNCNINN